MRNALSWLALGVALLALHEATTGRPRPRQKPGDFRMTVKVTPPVLRPSDTVSVDVGGFIFTGQVFSVWIPDVDGGQAQVVVGQPDKMRDETKGPASEAEPGPGLSLWDWDDDGASEGN